jgi:hypothetical protein
MGPMLDPVAGRVRMLWALIVTLSFSRYQFVWPTFVQTTETVCEGLDRAWTFFGAMIRTIVPDNMKAIVKTPDALNPVLVMAFLDYVQARGFYVDPARIRSRKDKPRVENQVPFVRESWFDGETLADLDDARRSAQTWCRDIAGARVHGTTCAVPREVFESTEKAGDAAGAHHTVRRSALDRQGQGARRPSHPDRALSTVEHPWRAVAPLRRDGDRHRTCGRPTWRARVTPVTDSVPARTARPVALCTCVAKMFEQHVELLDATARKPWLAVRGLGEERERIGTEIEDLLPFLIELGPLAVNGRELGGAMLRERRGGLAFRAAATGGLETTREDAKTTLVDEYRAGDVGRLRGHGIRRPLEHHTAGGAYEDGHTQSQRFRNDVGRTKVALYCSTSRPVPLFLTIVLGRRTPSSAAVHRRRRSGARGCERCLDALVMDERDRDEARVLQDFVALEQREHLPGLCVPATHFCGFPSPPFPETADFPERGAADFPEPSRSLVPYVFYVILRAAVTDAGETALWRDHASSPTITAADAPIASKSR